MTCRAIEPSPYLKGQGHTSLTNFRYMCMQYFDRAEVSARACAKPYLVQLPFTF